MLEDCWREIQNNSYIRGRKAKKKKIAWHRLIWTSFVVPKITLIAWMVILNRFPTKDRLRSWEIRVEGDCMLCRQANETRNRFFFNVPFQKRFGSKFSVCVD